MPLTPDDIETLRRLEESLWRAETRFDRAYMERVLAPDFFEFGRSGRRYDRAQILAHSGDTIRATLPLARFAVHPIGADAALVTYVSEVAYGTVERANRSSLWLRTEKGWRLQFHQGTPVA
ncbi:nuclear transport factor 2 family protein [Hypericibacter adhaerens]|uniref:nuclear transport factor 2 family protein n=1 Tax=Hypericibacter adhaerens TaxID=2602016 RepID=UPI001246A12E|nr:DUF4440 domain-containing protein [Hypericibacter adhaerens]